jgi:hypothetical protein
MEQSRKDELNKEEQQNNSYYSNWLSDNLKWLKDEYFEEHSDDFDKFCWIEFRDFMESRE